MTEKQNLRILVVDDEKAIRSFLGASLSSHGYNIFEAATAKEALEKSVSSHPDMIILDLGLPDIDGVEVLRRIRKRSKIPVIILSVREDAADKICALDIGADDYLIKPFSTGELLARIRALMRRLSPLQTKEVFQIGKLSMDVLSRRVMVDGREVDLTPTEYDILKLLILNVGKVLTHRHILQEIWNKAEDLEGVLHLLRVTISNLRSKIESNPDRPTYILTESGIGYRLRSED
ncbi:MAG: response regulator transcription factor [Candidatus Omnitrophota bacterium]|nr:response regulator transcription factor [Candidatus Omnitrophota bacterium]